MADDFKKITHCKIGTVLVLVLYKNLVQHFYDTFLFFGSEYYLYVFVFLRIF